MLTTEQRSRFKLALLARCLADGLDEEQTCELVKSATEALREAPPPPREKLAGVGSLAASTGFDLVKWIFNRAAPIAAAAPLVIPPLAGAALGWGLAKTTDIDDADVEEVKQRELLAELERLTQRASRNMVLRRYREQRAA